MKTNYSMINLLESELETITLSPLIFFAEIFTAVTLRNGFQFCFSAFVNVLVFIMFYFLYKCILIYEKTMAEFISLTPRVPKKIRWLNTEGV